MQASVVQSLFHEFLAFLDRRFFTMTIGMLIGAILTFALGAAVIVAHLTYGTIDLMTFVSCAVVIFGMALPLVLFVRHLLRDRRAARSMLAALVSEVIAARDEALRASHFKSRFLENLSHELRTPLNSIIGFSQLLQKQSIGPLSDARYLQYVENINLAGENLLKIVNTMFEPTLIASSFSGSETKREADIDSIISDVLHMVMPMAESQNVSLAYSGPMAGASLLLCERTLRQIMWSTLTNAVKSTEADGFVRVSVEHRPNGDLAIYVHDTGIGMSVEDVQAALKPFSWASNEMTNEMGSGVGLQLAKVMLELEGCSLIIDSVPGDGTIIGLIFPARIVAVAPLRLRA